MKVSTESERKENERGIHDICTFQLYLVKTKVLAVLYNPSYGSSIVSTCFPSFPKVLISLQFRFFLSFFFSFFFFLMSLFEYHLFRKYFLDTSFESAHSYFDYQNLNFLHNTYQNSLSLLFYSSKICIYRKDGHSIREESTSSCWPLYL